MTKNNRIESFSALGEWMLNLDENTLHFINTLSYKNPWYTTDNVLKQFQALGNVLNTESLTKWTSDYPDFNSDKIVGLVLAGNLPLVGFHDILSALIMGFTAQIKVSSDDAGLTTLVLQRLIEIEPAFNTKI